MNALGMSTFDKAVRLALVLVSFLSFHCLPALATCIDESLQPLITYHKARMYDTNLFPWHESMQALWDTHFSIAIQRQGYPFGSYSTVEIFEPIFKELIQAWPGSPNDTPEDTWAAPFMEPADTLLKLANDLLLTQNYTAASDAYMRVASVYKMAYFPWVHAGSSKSELKKKAWERDKFAYEKAMSLRDDLNFETVDIPFSGGDNQTSVIPAYLFTSGGKDSGSPAPVVVLVTGLDHYKTSGTLDIVPLLKSGYSVLTLCMPGTGDSPITGRDPEGDKEYWKAIIDWIYTRGKELDTNNINVWGISTGAYWAVKISRYEKDRVKRVVSQGTATHYTFTPDWLEAAEHMAYPTSLWKALSQAFGYDTKEELAENASKYSLLCQGLLEQESTFLLGVNGVQDTVFPIDDQVLLLKFGDGTQLRWFPDQAHTGRPGSDDWLQDWWRRQLTA